MNGKAKNIEVIILDMTAKFNAAKIIRDFSEESFSELLSSIELSEPIYSSIIIPERFYSGINDICSIVEKLDTMKISHLLLIDGEESSYKDVYEFKNLVDGMSLSDFR